MSCAKVSQATTVEKQIPKGADTLSIIVGIFYNYIYECILTFSDKSNYSCMPLWKSD